MPFDLALVDLVRPYLLRGETTTWHAALSVIYVESYETSLGPDGVVIRGIARFSGNIAPPTFDPVTGTLSAGAGNVEGHPRQQPDRTEPWLDITDTRLEFALSVPRTPGDIIQTGEAQITDTDFQATKDVLNTLDDDYPGTGFILDLVLAGIELRPPFLQPAQMEPNGLLIPHPGRNDVVFHLPKVKVRVSQGSDINAVLDVSLVSLGASGLDDPGDMSAAELIRMEPAYAFIGTGRVVGFGFRSAYLDLSDGYTPPEVLDKFGFDESWTGLYLPEIRIFFAPNGAEDFAVNGGVDDLLIGLGDSRGVSGDFGLAVINQGSGDLKLGARFFDDQGRAIGITRLTATTAEVRVPASSRMVIDVVGGRAPYTTIAQFDDSDHAGVIHELSTTAAGKTVVVQASDTSSPPKSLALTISVRLREAQVVELPPNVVSDTPATITTHQMTLGGVDVSAPELELRADSGDQVTIGLRGVFSGKAPSWEVEGAGAGSAFSVTVPLQNDQNANLVATITGDVINQINGYFRFDEPPLDNHLTFAEDEDNSSAEEAIDPSLNADFKPPARKFLNAWRDTLARIDPPTITIEGRASFEGDPLKATYNHLLSRRRAEGLAALIKKRSGLPEFTVNLLPPPGGQPDPAWTMEWQTHGEPREQWWRAEIRDFSVNEPDLVVEGVVSRPPAPETPEIPPPTDIPPQTPPSASWFRHAQLKVRIVQNQFVAVELSGSVDFETALEESINTSGAVSVPSLEGLGNNPSDGIVDFLFLYQTDPASQSDQVKLYLGADPNDKDGLLMTGQLNGQALKAPSTGRNILGMTTLFTPLLAEIAPANPADGGIAPIVLSAAVVALPSALAEIEIDGERLLNIERVVLYGGEAVFYRQGDRWETSILFDVETALSAKIKLGGFTLLEIPRESPLAVRYKAIGLKFGQPPGSTAGWELRPVFDQSKGYTIDVSGPGQIRLPDPLGQILQVLGARIARTNPLNFEIDLGFAVDLGVISVDRARVRLPLDPLGPPELTAFGAGLKVPGVIEGKGYMEMNNSGGAMEIKGGIDVSLIPIKLRVAAQVAVAQIPPENGGPATGVAIALEVELPVAIPLAQSGFGIYGFLGLFAMHYGRDESDINSLTPALEWLKTKAEGDPTNLKAWKPEVNRWAFGAGITLGTMGSPVIFNVKGMFLLELPGPRILLMVKANLLAVLPELKDKNAEGTFLCVIDLDFGRGTLTIGLSIDFSIKPIVEIQIPIEAYFNLKQGGDWHVYLGTFPGTDTQGRPMPGPIRINVLEVFNGAGYVMISGHGIPSYQPPGTNLPALPAVQGTALAMGLEVSLLWGNTSINLYVRATAGFNAILGFDPFYVGGLLYIRGELKLFIISLSASAGLSVQIGQKVTIVNGVEVLTEVSRIDGEICGELDLFFFTLKGCVDFHMGEENKLLPPAPKLVTAASLVSRSPALVQGSGVDRGIDSKLGDAIASASQPADLSTLPEVPIDSIPVLVMSATPRDDDLKVFDEQVEGDPGAPSDGFVKRGDFAYRYDLKEVRLETSDGTPALMDGNTPSVWWTQSSPTDSNLTTQLAMLTWTPNPTPKALERTEHLDETVRERWGTVCHDAAPAAPVLWTFCEQPLGPSETGWTLQGTPWPDPEDTERSENAGASLRVYETWRTGNRDLDRRRGLVPAIVVGGKVNCLPDGKPEQPPRDPVGPAANLRDLRADLRSDIRLPDTRLRLNPDFSGRLELERNRLFAATAGSRGVNLVERLDAPAVNLEEAIRRVNTGSAILRSELLGSITGLGAVKAAGSQSGTGTNTATTGGQGSSKPLFDGPLCDGRILASPVWDIGLPVVFGNRANGDQIAQQLKELGHQHGPLSDVIRIDASGQELQGVHKGALLIWANERFAGQRSGNDPDGLRVHYLDENNQRLGERVVTAADLVSITGVPARWTDTSGPWIDSIFHTVMYAQTNLPGYVPLYIDLDPPGGTVKVDIGVHYRSVDVAQKMAHLGRPYYVGAIELTSMAEAHRESYDQTSVERNREVVESFLGPESANVALLYPGKLYKITTVTEVTVRDDEGNVQADVPQNDTYWFRTDDQAPPRLDPWLLCTTPAEAEQHVFGHEPLKVIFGTNAIDQLYGAYGLELRARLKAASFRQVEEEGIAHPFPLNADTLINIKAHLLSPFEAALTDVLAEQGPCIAVDEERVRHSAAILPIPLDPYTDYLLDIEAVPIGAADTATGMRVLRRSFSTGGFSSLDDFVLAFAGARTEHRAVPPGAIQSVAALFSSRAPEGAEFDNALMDAGFEPMGLPRHPRVQVLWSQAGPASEPQPVGVLVDAPEPLYRERPLPEEITTDDDVPVKRLVMTPQPWLELAEKSGGGLVSQVVYAPGGQRALVALSPGARGEPLQLVLTRNAFTAPYLDGESATDQSYTIVAETLRKAPWEED